MTVQEVWIYPPYCLLLDKTVYVYQVRERGGGGEGERGEGGLIQSEVQCVYVSYEERGRIDTVIGSVCVSEKHITCGIMGSTEWTGRVGNCHNKPHMLYKLDNVLIAISLLLLLYMYVD